MTENIDDKRIENNIENAVNLIKEKLSNVQRELVVDNVYEHSLRVAGLVCQYTDNWDLLTAAYLHDIVEDSDITSEDVENLFGYDISFIVQQLTNSEYGMNSMGRCKYMIKKFLTLSQDILTIKLCDRLDNIYDFAKMYDSPKYKGNEAYGNVVIGWYACETQVILNHLYNKGSMVSTSNQMLINRIQGALNELKY